MNNPFFDFDNFIDFLKKLIIKILDERVNVAVDQKIATIKLTTEPEKPILIDDVAQMLGYSKSHIYTLCRTGKIPFIRMGRWLYFYVSDINNWLREK